MRTGFLTVAAALLLAAPAEAQIAIGPGAVPGVAVDSAGTAHIAYNGAEAGQPPHYCRLPRGAGACDVALTLPVTPNTDTLSRPVVTVSGTRVSVVVHRYGQQTAISRYTSTNGGLSFAAPAVAGGHVPNLESVVGPGDTVSVVSFSETAGGLLQSVPLGGGTAGPVATLFDGTRPYNGTVGLIDATTPLAIFATGSGNGAFRRYAGSGDINNQANWTAPVDIGYVDYPRLAGGPAGLFLIAGDETSGLFVRKWDGATFGPRVALTANGDDSEMHMAQDAAGRLHAVYPSGRADGFHVVHAVSDNGVNWLSGTVSVQTDDEPSSMRVAAAPDHVGVAVWHSSAAGGREIRVATIGPGAPVTPGPPLPPPPVPPPVVTPVPTPAFGKTVVVRPVSGVVRVRLPRSSRFVDLTALDDVPLGATIDTKRGVVELSSKPRSGAVQTIRLDGGWFRVSQNRTTTDFSLNEPLAPCGRGARLSQRKPKSRKLWGDGKGRFRTKGRYSAATVRGTRWLVQDTCAGTLTRVTQGSVVVRHGRRAIVVRAGKRYLARRPR